MPKSVTSYYSYATTDGDDNEGSGSGRVTSLNSPTASRRLHSSRTSDLDLRSRLPARPAMDEATRLLAAADGRPSYLRGRDSPATEPTTPRRKPSRQQSLANNLLLRNHSRGGSFALKVAKALGTETNVIGEADVQRKGPLAIDDRVWYDQFTSTDWVHDSIADAFRVKELRSRRDIRGKFLSLFDAAQGWILVAVIGCLTAAVAYFIDVTEATVFDFKTGYCTTKWYYGKKACCGGASICDHWARWSVPLTSRHERTPWVDFVVFNFWSVALAVVACLITLQTKTSVSSAISLSTLDENLGAPKGGDDKDNEGRPVSVSPGRRFADAARRPPMVYYPAAGSGVAEVKVILSGFVLHGYLGVKTLVAKSFALILSVGSGLSLGKEGPYVHIATCIGNIACRMFSKYNHNDGKRREVLSAAAASGVAVAFGAPISGVLFSLEEVSYYFPPKTLFRTFFCCIAAALSLKFLNPYGTNKIVLFEVRYLTDWRFFEIVAFILLGILGGILGAGFIKASKLWAQTFRRIPAIKQYPVLEVFLVALLTGLVSFWNRYTRVPVAELLYELAAPCDSFSSSGTSLCPTEERIVGVIGYLCIAFVIKAILTTITFGIKVPAGIYVPSMVVGGLLGRIVGHAVQLLVMKFPNAGIWGDVPVNGNPESIVVPGVYALTAAGATMCGVTRLSVTLAVILFELTGSLEHVLPFSIAVLVSKWTADALEPLSIYDLLTDMNAYPYLDSKARPVFTGDLGDITHPPKRNRLIDISESPLVPAVQLRRKLDIMHMAGEIDGGLPIVRDGVLVGLIPGPDLEFALDNLSSEEEERATCLMSPSVTWAPVLENPAFDSDDETGQNPAVHTSDVSPGRGGNTAENGPDLGAAEALRKAQGPRLEQQADPTDFTPYIDPAPVSLDICSPMDLVFECFVKLGLRYICVTKGGQYAGLVHKKAFVRYVKDLEEEQRIGR